MPLRRATSRRRACVLVCALAAVPVAGLAQAAPVAAAAPASQRIDEASLTLLELRLLEDRLSDALVAYREGRDVLLPLGELARQLTLAIRTQPAEGTAQGYILSEDRSFHLDAVQGLVTLRGQTQPYDRALVRVLPDDIYVASALLSRWLPLDFEVNLSSLALRVLPREQLPLQARLARERAGARAGRRGEGEDRGYPRHVQPHRLLGVPSVDQTFNLGVVGGAGRRTHADYAAYLTGDFAGTEGSAYISSTRDKSSPDVRFSLARHDPEAGLLSLLRARSVRFGSSVSAPSVRNITAATVVGDGHGLFLSSRPINQPTNFDRHTLEGELPPGWDVELFYNEALVGFQSARADGRYRFEDQPLAYGQNEFRLVFHGPLGQQRVERRSFDLAQATVPAGSFYYTVGQHRGDGKVVGVGPGTGPGGGPGSAGGGAGGPPFAALGSGGTRTVSQFDWGISRALSASGGLVQLPPLPGGSGGGTYAHAGLRGYFQPFILGTEFFHAPGGGLLNESVLKTRLGQTAVSLSHVQASDYTSEVFLPTDDPLRSRDTVRLDGSLGLPSLPRLPYSLEVLREGYVSGRSNKAVGGRLSAFVRGTSLSTQLAWLSLDGSALASGSTQVSRRVGASGLSAQLGYTLRPQFDLDIVALTAERRLASGYLLNMGLAHNLSPRDTLVTAGVTRDFGAFGLGVSASRTSHGIYGVALQLFVAIGRDPRNGSWRFDAMPRADTGSASVRLYLDRNGSGRYDHGDEPVENAAVLVDGARATGRSDGDGLLWLDRLPVHQGVDVAVDAQTLEDPTWQPLQPGWRLVPRPGAVAELDFPVTTTSELEGHVFLLREGGRRGIGNALVEVLDAQGAVVASTRSSWDGYYVVDGLRRGAYTVRVAPDQLLQLGLADPGVRPVTARPDGELIKGVDFVLQPPARRASP